MIYEYFPRGQVDYRSLRMMQCCEWDEYPPYNPDEPLWAQPFILTLPKGICTKHRVLDKHGRLVVFDPPLYDEWTEKRIASESHTFRSQDVEYVPGTVVTFNTSFGDSYGHWISEIIPCFYIARMCRIPRYKIYIDLGRTDNFFKADTLEAMGHEVERLIDPKTFPCQTPCFLCKDIIDAQYHPYVRADNVIFVRKTRYSNWAKDFVRSSFLNLARPSKTNRRLYVSRKQEIRRKIVNETQVEALLKRYGFETIHSDNFWKPFRHQVKMFREAEIVVTQRASIFYNLWFCKPEFNLVVLWQKGENMYPGIIDKFRNVTNIFCDPVPCEEAPNDRNADDILVDVGDLEQQLIGVIQ